MTAVLSAQGLHELVCSEFIVIYYYGRLEGLIVEEEESRRSVHHPHRSDSPDIIELIREAQDHRSGLLYLVHTTIQQSFYDTHMFVSSQPNPDSVRCLVLAGCLLTDQPHRPGKIQPIPRLRRLPVRPHEREREISQNSCFFSL